MKRGIALVLLLAAAPAPAAPGKQRSFRLRLRDRSVRVVVPAVFEPLLPGSVYPNRRKPAPPRPLPLVVVDRTLAKAAGQDLLDRGCIVAELAPFDRAGIDGLLAELPRHVDTAIAEVTVLSARAGDVLSDPRIRAAALFDPPDFRPEAGAACVPVELFRRTVRDELPDLPATRDCVREKWYRTSAGFPPEAFRDAAEWLAAGPNRRD
ncbi:MAG TPA: hypothetical protein VFS34_04990 [Thermoanaerobaculia bacterium]|nr:hypothetical protein [Thermoanaerobaculia bacterium]